MSVCKVCNGVIKNTGVASGVKPFNRIYGMYLVPLVADDGTRNGIDTNAADMDQELLDLVNNPDPTKRFYPLLGLNAVTPASADSKFAEDETGKKTKTLDGIDSLSFERWNATRQEFNQLRDVCVDFGIILIDSCGNLLGEYDKTTGKYFPREVNEGSYDSKYTNADADNPSKIMISFDYDLITSEADQIMISFDSFTAVTPLKLKGMLDVNIEVVSVDSNTTVTVKGSLNYGFAGDLLAFKGASASDFTLYNNTQDSAIAVDSITPDPSIDGQYQLTMATADAPTAADVIEVDVFRAATANNQTGFEGVEVTFDAIV